MMDIGRHKRALRSFWEYSAGLLVSTTYPFATKKAASVRRLLDFITNRMLGAGGPLW